MRELISKHGRRRSSHEVEQANTAIENAIRRLTRLLARSLARWHPIEGKKTEFLARATLARAARYTDSALLLLTARNKRSLSQGLDLLRTALEHAYVLAVLSQERDVGTSFVVDWAQRMEAKKLKKLLDAPYGDNDDKALVSDRLEKLHKTIGREIFPRPTIGEIVERANLRTTHTFMYASLNRYSHFDLPKTLEIAYEAAADLPVDVKISHGEHKCESLHQLLEIILYMAIARRDFGENSVAEEIEKCAKVLSRTQAIAYRVSDDL